VSRGCPGAIGGQITGVFYCGDHILTCCTASLLVDDEWMLGGCRVDFRIAMGAPWRGMLTRGRKAFAASLPLDSHSPRSSDAGRASCVPEISPACARYDCPPNRLARSLPLGIHASRACAGASFSLNIAVNSDFSGVIDSLYSLCSRPLLINGYSYSLQSPKVVTLSLVEGRPEFRHACYVNGSLCRLPRYIFTFLH
jgi:hypothetical protein